jgi:hypothetical protein
MMWRSWCLSDGREIAVELFPWTHTAILTRKTFVVNLRVECSLSSAGRDGMDRYGFYKHSAPLEPAEERRLWVLQTSLEPGSESETHSTAGAVPRGGVDSNISHPREATDGEASSTLQ